MQYSKFLVDTKGVLKKFKTKKIDSALVELVAIGPYLTNVSDPDRKAKSVLTLLKADAEGFMDLSLEPGETIESYLSDGMYFGTEETPALKKRNALMAIIAINDQFKDREKDKKAKKANMFDLCANDDEAAAYKTELVSNYVAVADSIKAPEVEKIMTTQTAVARGSWSN